jgi:hypothetical protein
MPTKHFYDQNALFISLNRGLRALLKGDGTAALAVRNRGHHDIRERRQNDRDAHTEANHSRQ